jgi:hypothetical protein
MIHATSNAGRLKLAAEYREADIRRAARERAEAEAKGPRTATLQASAEPRATSPITRLTMLLLRER